MILKINSTRGHTGSLLVSITIMKLANKNSCGFDGISTNVLKIIEPAITKPLTILTNQVLCTGMFPDKLKIAKVIPIHKKGDATVFNNYRPISLLPAISKVLEKKYMINCHVI